VKHIVGRSLSFEDKINNAILFLEKENNIIDVKYGVLSDNGYSALILYEIKIFE
jgi:hypothetical protein